MLSATVLHRGTGASSTIRFWDDSTIDTIQIQIGEAVGVHPDRLRIYVQGEFEGDYYAKDARKWENLFLRMSPEGKPVRKNLAIYNSHRSDSAIPFELADYDKTAWMNMDPVFETTFRELRIMGVPEDRAWILPLNNTETPEYTPPASKTSIDIKSIFKTHHPYKVLQFEVIEHTPELLPQIELLYYPRLRVGSPATVSPDTFRAVTRQLEVVRGVRDFAASSAPKPDRVSVVQVRWKLPIVDTDFGNAIRNRFEQIFYGTTLSKDIPVISFFSSRQEQSRHKFFTDNSEKTPFMDLRLWSAWWTASRPVKNKPALLLFRGEGRHSYDRITVTSTEITLSCARGDNPDRKEKETIEDLRQSIKEFLLSVDGLVLNPADVDDDRWILQDASAIVHYTKDLRDADFRRFDCLRSIYEVTNADKLVFRLLRADQSDSGLSDNQVTAIQLLKDDENLTSEDLREQIPELTSSESISLLANVKSLLIDAPDLADRSTIRLPAFKFSSKSVAVTHSPDLGRILQYINVLRDVLIHPDNSDLDAFCPKRAESVEAEIAAAAPPAAPVEVDAAAAAPADDDEFDILAMIAEDAPSVPIVPSSIVSEALAAVVGAPEKKKPAKKVTTARGASGSMALYFSDQLHKFDSQTYDPADSQIFRKCDRPRQPVIVPAADLARFEEGGEMSEYAPDGAAGKTLEVTDPDGTVICPELWCATDRIPLTPAQLVEGACPICRGKIRSTDKAAEKTQDTTEFSILQRDAKFAYPGFVKYQSKKNNKPIPCCFMTAQTTKVSFAKKDKKSSDAGAATPSVAEAFYVLGETKTRLGELRLGYIPGFLSKLLKIPTDYGAIVDAGNRVQSGQGSFFRVGVGRASTSLPRVIPHMKGRIKSPAENSTKVVMCSFFRTWKGADGEGEDPIARRISSIDKAFREKTLTVLEELEYCCLAAGCRLYVVFLSPTTGEVQTSCFMPMRSTKAVIYTHTILVAIDSADPLSVDYIANVTRTTTSPAINADLTYTSYDLALRTTLAALVLRLEETRVAACTSEVPSIEDAFAAVRKMMPDEIARIKLIRDPYRRIQALYIPKRILLPFRPATQVPQAFLGGTASDVLDDYANISPDDYPSRLEMISALSSAKEIHAGFEYAHDVHDIHHRVVELVTRAGLRVPVASDVATDSISPVEEIVQTTSAAEEATLAFGKPDPDAVKRARSITYEAEIFDFLLFQLAKDVQTGDYPTLKSVLGQPNPNVDELRPLLDAWMEEALRFSEADEPSAFYGKIRQPCRGRGEDKCSGLCVWDGASCKVQVKSGVREGLRRDVLAKRLLSTLASNDKIRGVVFENRASPFFSSILYLEFPHEVILSDEDVYNIVRPSAASASA